MLKTVPLSLKTKNYAVPYYQTSKENAWSLKPEKLKKMKVFKNLKNANFVKKIAKICNIQKLKPIPWLLKKINNLLSNS